MATVQETSGTGTSGQQWSVSFVENDTTNRIEQVVVSNPGGDTITAVATYQGQQLGPFTTTQSRTFNVPNNTTVIDDRRNPDGTRNLSASFGCTIWNS